MLRWSKRILLGLLALLVLVASAVLLLLGTAPGRDLVREQAESLLDDLLVGEVRIGEIERLWPTGAAIRDITVTDAQGREAVVVGRIEVELSPLALLSQTVQVDRVHIDRAHILVAVAPDGTLNLATLVEPSTTPPTPPDPDAEPWTIHIDTASVARSRVEYRTPTRSLSIDRIGLAGRAMIRDPIIEVRDLALDAYARPTVRGGHLDLSLATGQLEARARAIIDPQLVQQLTQLPELVGGAELDLYARRGSDKDPWHAGVRGELAGAPLVISATAAADLSSAAVSGAGTGLDPAAIFGAAPAGNISFVLDGRLARLEPLEGQLDLGARGTLTVPGTPRARPFTLDLEAAADGAALGATLRLEGLGAKIRGDLRGRTSTRTPVIDAAEFTVRVGELDAVALGLTDLSGSLGATVTAHGPIDDLTVSVDLRARRLGLATVRTQRLDVSARLQGVPSRITGQASIDIAALEAGEILVGDARIAVRATDAGQKAEGKISVTRGDFVQDLRASLRMTREAHHTWIFVPMLTAETPSARWRLEDARVHLTPKGDIEVHRLVLQSNKGIVSLDAELHPDLLGGPGFVKATIEDLHLASVRRDFGQSWPVISGLASATVDVRLGPAPKADVRVEVDDLRYPGLAGSVRGRIELKLDKSVATASIAVTGVDLGRFRLDAELKTPAQALDPEAWVGFTGQGLRRLEVRADALALAGLEPLIRAGFLGGKVDLRITSAQDLTALDLQLDARDVRHREVPGPLTLTLTTAVDGESTVVTGALGIADHALAGMMVRIEAGLGAWIRNPQRTAETSDAQLEVALDGFPVALMEDFAPEPPGVTVAPRKPVLSGEITASAQLARKSGAYTGHVQAEALELRWAEGAPKITATVAVSLSDSRVELNGGLHGAGVGGLTLAGRGRTPRDLTDVKAWNALGTRALEALTLQTDALDLAALDRMSDRRLALRGTVTTRLEVAAALERIDAYVKLSDFGKRDSKTETDGVIVVQARPGSSRLDLGLFQGGKQVLSATASVPLGPRDFLAGQVDLAHLPLDARVSMSELPLAALAEAAELSVPMGGTLTGTIAVSGTASDYRVGVFIDASRATVKKQAFDRFVMNATLDPRRIRARAQAKEKRAPGRLDLDATVDLTTGGTIDAALRAERFRLDFLSAFFQRQGSIGGVAGVLDADVRFSGTPEAPSTAGDLRVYDFSMVMASPVPPLEHTQIHVRFDEQDVNLTAEGRSGDGSLEITAHAKLQTLTTLIADLRLTTDEIPVVLGPRQALIDALVMVRAEVQEEKTTIDVSIESAKVDIPNASGEAYKMVQAMPELVYVDEQRRRLITGTSTAAEPPPALALTIETKKDIPIRGSEITATARVDLEIDGNATSGQVSVSDGWVTLFGKRWQINQAHVNLLGTDEPQLQVEISRDLGSAVAIVRVRGTPAKPELELTSDPPIFDKAQVLTFVLGAEPGSGDEAVALEDRAAAAAVGALVGSLRSKLEDVLPIDTLEIELGDGAAVSRLAVGKWISSRIFLGYEYAFEAEDDENTNEAVVQVRIGRGWVLESRYGDRGSGGMDFIWVKRF